jgi:hypothetical protein
VSGGGRCARSAHEVRATPATAHVQEGDDLARFANVVWADEQPIEPRLLVVGLDTEGRLHNLAMNNERASQMMLTVDELLAVAEELSASALGLVEIRTERVIEPDPIEVETFMDLADDCAARGLLLLDCVASVGHRWWSLRSLAA